MPTPHPKSIPRSVARAAAAALTLLLSACQTAPAPTPSAVKPPVDPVAAAAPSPSAPAPAPVDHAHGPNASNATEDPAPSTNPVRGTDPATAGAAAAAVPATPAGPDPVLDLDGRVVFGVRRLARTGAVIEVCRCFQVIPAYQRIRREDLPRTRPDYTFLMAQATEQFENAVEAVAFREGIDLVIAPDKNAGVPAGSRDLTDAVIAYLRGGR